MSERSWLRCLQSLSHPLPDRRARRAALPSQSCRGTSERPAEGAGPGPTLTLQPAPAPPVSAQRGPAGNCSGRHRVQSLPRLALSQHMGVNMTCWSRDTPTSSSPSGLRKTRQNPQAQAACTLCPLHPRPLWGLGIPAKASGFPKHPCVCKHTRVRERKRCTAGQEGNLVIKGKPVFQENLHLVGTLP